ncbi:DUF4226 domain-containing protein [Mycobacterium sp. 852002-51057_SCH5723018]|uniref:DUF4226 domain-containing protein n=1 Tax=Mycobacterium sp. 852002-51057_SCH5723018 TaxID=1834094 RepID=UPI000801FE0A|nr:DUF4226 domain-containing protein [Mycobacterium sp. 852002-51057_SCH5723018]OBG28702.1 hypothetical protein A5764_24110 [Mycobacterium sp. 852002-51057_SCH5723018]
MSAYDDLIDAIRYLQDRTGDANAWQAGLAPGEVVAVVTPTTRPDQLDAILRKIRQQHPVLFGAVAPGASAASPPSAGSDPSSDREQGEAAEAMAGAEAALAHQNSASSQLDMQVVAAILNAHQKAVEGRDALTKLQRDIEAAVLGRSDLDTPAGARDFQRFLIGKLKDIRAVVLNASLDDTSKSALMAAWTSLYNASKNDPPDPPQAAAVPVAPAAGTTDPGLVEDPAMEGDPLLDSMFTDDPGLPPGDSSEPAPPGAAAAPVSPPAPLIPPIPNLGAGSGPGLGTAPGSLAGWSAPGGLPLPEPREGSRTDAALDDPNDEGRPGSDDPDASDDADGHDGHEEVSADKPESPAAGPTPVTLPDGDTVTAASPQLAAAIQAAVGGAPIADAFHRQGITIPTPGTAVANPIEPLQAAPGDVGIFTDRHALALGHEKALLDGQIQRIATVGGPTFLGWEHPPAATAPATAPAKTDTPTPTRPAATSTTRQ